MGHSVIHIISDNEASQSTTQQEQDSLSLRDIHSELIDKLGVNWNQHSLVTMSRQTLGRILHYDSLYQRILGLPVVVLEFGVQWGSTMSQLLALRGTYEPYNNTRKIYGFNTFTGFTKPATEKDGNVPDEGQYSTYLGYEKDLAKILRLHELESPIPHLQKFELIKGDVSSTASEWSKSHPNTPVAMAIFDMDIYRPTKDALEAVTSHFIKGSILIFDELLAPAFPGDLVALSELLPISGLKLHQNPHQPNAAWIIWGE